MDTHVLDIYPSQTSVAYSLELVVCIIYAVLNLTDSDNQYSLHIQILIVLSLVLWTSFKS